MKNGRDAITTWTAENNTARSKLQARKLAAQARLNRRIRRRSSKPLKIEAEEVVPVPKEADRVKVAMAPVSPAASPGSPSPATQKWETHIDDSTGCAYYFNVETGETTWDMPMEILRRVLPGNGLSERRSELY